MSVFEPVDSTLNFPQAESRVLDFWKANRIFEQSMKQREPAKGTKHWVFYEGPPTANGKPHPGHVLTRVVKDLFPRYKTMCGYYVPRKAGWDTHGLPVEIEVEKELKLNGKTEVEKYGVEPFVRKCMDSVFRYTQDWEQLTEKIGFWIDLKDAYVTYHQSYVESVWWSLKELHAKNLLYRGHKILPWCPHCQTALSSHEVGLGYQEVEDPSVFVTFRDANWEQNKTSFLAWTTTPWTLPSNAGLAVKADTEYSHVKVGEETLIMATALVKNVMGKMKYEVVKTEPGTALVGRAYQPLFAWWRPVSRASRPQVTSEEFRTRGFLPHLRRTGGTYHVVFRLHGTIPTQILNQYRIDRDALKQRVDLSPEQKAQQRDAIEAKIEDYLDKSDGDLRKPEMGGLVQSALLHFDKQRYDLHAWCVMPNHVHVVVTPRDEHKLEDILHSWKSFTAHQLSGRLGSSQKEFWQPEYYDRLLRDEREFFDTCEYVENNPLAAGLVQAPAEWKFSSAADPDRRQLPQETSGRDARDTVWRVHAAEFVTLDTGSGIVHVAPAFGADDYALGQKAGMPVIQLVGPDGKFTSDCGAFAGRFVKEADNDIIRDLKARGLLLKREGYKHDYPFCWRCKTPLIYFARGGWFIRTTREIGHVIENNKKVDWHPEHIRDGRFGSFLESNIDWALSRERYWGTPLNVWQCENGHQEAVGSFAELKTKPNAKGLDAFDVAKKKDPSLNEHLRVHKPWIDAATFSCSQCGKEMKRTTEVIDCWYDSGAMPFAQWGYPHQPGSKERFNLAFPADFISEAIDQTRGWFYSLIAESTLLNGSFAAEGSGPAVSQSSVLSPQSFRPYPIPYKTCLVLGHVCDEKGEKMSKSKGNYLDPNLILAEEGADALRWFFYSSTNPWTSARFSRPAVREAQKEFLIKLRNVYSFFVIYANIDGFDPGELDQANQGRTLLDRWILSELHQTIKAVRGHLDGYDIFAAAQALSAFVESLSNWYVRRSRERFWASWQSPAKDSPRDREKLSAYWTLYEALVTTSQLIAPFVPFLAEEVWQNLSVLPMGDDVPQSVHLCNYPDAEEGVIDAALGAEFALVREVASLGRAARSGAKLKTRQPLSEAVIVLSGATMAGERQVADPRQNLIEKHKQLILDELNVKELVFAADAQSFVDYEMKPNFKAIGAKHREKVPAVKSALAQVHVRTVRNDFNTNGKHLLNLNPGCPIQHPDDAVWITPEEVEVSLKAKEGYAAASGRSVVVVLDTQLTPELLDEGVAREIVNRINGWRSDLKLAYEQRIHLGLKGSARLEEVAKKFSAYICQETLALDQHVGELPSGYETLEVDVEGEKATLALKRA